MMNLRNRIHRLSRQLRGSNELFYVSDRENWVLRWVGHYITNGVQTQFGLKAHLDKDLKWAMPGDVLHFGSLGAIAGAIQSAAWKEMGKDKSIVATVFHGQRGEKQFQFSEAIDVLLRGQEEIRRIVTASRMMEERILEWGILREKVARIPLGVDLGRFHPVEENVRLALRADLGIPDEAFVIGSFQKDGEGWDEGLSPKQIKGPDVFLEVLERVSAFAPVFVLLTGPARGYVKAGLDRLGIPYTHAVLEDFLEIPRYYQCLDLYLVTSREEGGPQAILEAPACGVPLVSTRVGLAPDVITTGENGLLSDSEDVASLTEQVRKIVQNGELRGRLTANGLKTIQAYDWGSIAEQYYREVYEPLLKNRPFAAG